MMWKAAVLFAVLLGFAAAHAGEAGPQYRGMQVDAMGRSGTASINGVSSLYLNPAGLAGLQDNGIEASGDFGINNEVLDYVRWLNRNAGALNHFDSLLNHIGSIENRWASLSNTYSVQGHYHNFAVSVVRDSRYDVSLDKAALLPKLGSGMLSDLQVAAGGGFVLSPDWNIGFTAKYLDRERVDDKIYGENDDEYYTMENKWQESGNSLFDKLDKVEVASEFASSEQGIGINLGVNHSLSNGFSVGASFLDLPSFLDGELLYPEFNAGLSYATNFGAQTAEDGWRYPTVLHFNLVVNIDWQTPIGISQPWFKELKTGAALQAWIRKRQIVSLAAGLNDGYPTFGVRMGYILHAYYLLTSEEVGEYPGQEPLSFQRFGIDLDI